QPVLRVVNSVSFGQHALVQDAGNQKASGVLAVEHDVPANLYTTQARANIIASPTQRRIVRQHLAACLQITDVAEGLVLTPSAKSIRAEAQHVGFGAARETKEGHGWRGFVRSLRAFRTRSNGLPLAMPLASPSSMAARSAASFASYCCSSRSSVRSAVRTTSLAFSYRPLSTFSSTKRSSSSVKLTFRVGTIAPSSFGVAPYHFTAVSKDCQRRLLSHCFSAARSSPQATFPSPFHHDAVVA